jgi:hypothetical protein
MVGRLRVKLAAAKSRRGKRRSCRGTQISYGPIVPMFFANGDRCGITPVAPLLVVA